jgi:hypothetical protein
MTPWGYQHTAKLSVHTAGTASPKHMTHYTVAMAFIQAHGHFAALTKDGLLALSQCFETEHADPSSDDRWTQLPMVFEVDEDGMVPSRDVREWLGY